MTPFVRLMVLNLYTFMIKFRNRIFILDTEHYNGVITSSLASQITSLTIVYSTVYSKKTLKLRVTGLCAENSPVTGEFIAQRASNAENVSIWWRHHELKFLFRGDDVSQANVIQIIGDSWYSFDLLRSG